MLACASGSATTLDAGKDGQPIATRFDANGPIVPPYDAGPAPGRDAAIVEPPDAGPSIYVKLGGHAGVLAFVQGVVDDVLKDPQQASYFALVGNAGHPTRGQIEECFTDLMGHFTGGLEDYPTTTADGFRCRSMKDAHSFLHIPNGVFNDFVGIIAAHGSKAVNAGVLTQKDLDSIAALLDSQQPVIVDPTRADGGYFGG